MSARTQGLRRTAAVTAGLAAASVVGSLAVAAVARADTQYATSTTSGSSSAGTGTSNAGTGTSNSGTASNGSTDSGGSSLSNSNGVPHATSGGS
jgi:hypothetical protein